MNFIPRRKVYSPNVYQEEVVRGNMGCPLYWQIINPAKSSKIALKGLSERWSDPQYLFTDKEGRCFTVPILFQRWKLILTIRVLSKLKKLSLHCLLSWCKSIWNSIVTFVLCYWNVMKQERIKIKFLHTTLCTHLQPISL